LIGKLNLIGRCVGVNKAKIEALFCTEDKMLVLSNDNSCIVYSENGAVLSTIYPPPTAKTVKELHYHNSLVYLLLSSGTICVFNHSTETSLLHKIIYTGDIKDSEGKSVIA
jgi:uncharacterized protein YlzI (FlbEa/FlbD family)